MPNVFRVRRDSAAMALTKYSVQSHDRHSTARNDLAEYRARAHRGKLVSIANQHQLAAARYCLKQVVRKVDIHHGHFVYHNQIRVQHLRLAIGSVFAGQQTQRFMERHGRKSGRLLHPARCTTGRRAAHDLSATVPAAVNIQ